MPTVHEWQCRPTGAYFFAMLVSAAIDPYRKSYGNSRNSSATADGQERQRTHDRLAEKDVRSRRPGVRDGGGDGDARGPPAPRSAGRFVSPALVGTALDPKTLPLASHGAPEILELRLDHVVDRLAGLAHVLGHVIAVVRDVLANLVARNALPQLAAALRRPPGANAYRPERRSGRPSSLRGPCRPSPASSVAGPTARGAA